MMLKALAYAQANYPKLVDSSHWLNLGFTTGNIILNHETILKIAGFLFVTVPLGVVQWWNLLDRFKERRAKRNVA